MFEMFGMVESWIFCRLGVMVFCPDDGMANNILYRKAGPHDSLIVYGLGGTSWCEGHGTLVLPMVPDLQNLSLELMSFDVAPQQGLGHQARRPRDVEAVAQIKVYVHVSLCADRRLNNFNARRSERKTDPVGDGNDTCGQHRTTHGGRIVNSRNCFPTLLRGTCAEDMIKKKKNKQNGVGSWISFTTQRKFATELVQVTNMAPGRGLASARPDVATAGSACDTAIQNARLAQRESPYRKARPIRRFDWQKPCPWPSMRNRTRSVELKRAHFLGKSRNPAAQAARRMTPTQHHPASGCCRTGKVQQN